MSVRVLEEFIRNVERALINFSLTMSDLSEIEILAKQARELEQDFAYFNSTESHVVASNIQNSTVIATGDVQVVGSGCYISKIQAGKKVNICGVVRGGQIQAGGDVYIEGGLKGGAISKVMVPTTAVVTVGTPLKTLWYYWAGNHAALTEKKCPFMVG